MKALILQIIARKPTSTRAIGAELHRRRVDVAVACEELAAQGLIVYEQSRRRWRVADAPAAAAPVRQAVEPPAPKRTTAAAFTPVEILRDDACDVLVIQTGPSSYDIKAPSSLHAEIAETLAEMATDRLESTLTPLTKAEQKRLKRMVINRVMWGAL